MILRGVDAQNKPAVVFLPSDHTISAGGGGRLRNFADLAIYENPISRHPSIHRPVDGPSGPVVQQRIQLHSPSQAGYRKDI